MDREGQTAVRVTLTGSVFNVLLVILKAGGGVLFHSTALLADAVDSAGDLVSDMITLLAVRISRRPIDRDHPYGHGRFESLASLFVGTMLFGAGVSIAYKAISALTSNEHGMVGWPALLVALFAVISKESLFRWTRRVGRRLHSRVLEANAYHHRSDAFSSSAVLVGVGAALLIPGAAFMDSVASLLVTLFIFASALRIILSAVNDLTDKEQDPEFLKAVEAEVLEVPTVLHAHRTRSRRYGSLVYLDIDIEVDGEMSVRQGHDVAHQVKERVLAAFPQAADILVHVEPEGSHLDGEGPVRGGDPSATILSSEDE